MDVRKAEGKLEILGFWPEDAKIAGDAAFAAAFRAGMVEFLAYLGVGRVVAKGEGARVVRGFGL